MIQVKRMTIKSVLKKLGLKKYKPYSKNRGGRPLKQRVVDHIANNFNSYALRSIMIDQTGMIIDGHHRIAGIQQRIMAKKMTAKDLQFKLIVEIVPRSERESVYVDSHVNNPHDSKQELCNTDMYFGKLIERVVKQAKIPISYKHYPVIANILYGQALGAKTWAEMYNTRSQVKRLVVANTPIDMEQAQVRRISMAVVWAYECLNKTGILRFQKSAGLFGMLVAAKLSAKALDATKVAANIANKERALTADIAELSRKPKLSTKILRLVA